ncbi:hypothetical protein [Algoriphagus terrigena]|uniref:hypothetical protein n=1 Tax=Algoriphagus terrigena TaxID=344884 RepID=UPI00040CD3CD|nr:hypothetical protein [Algoriphagus terrigena]
MTDVAETSLRGAREGDAAVSYLGQQSTDRGRQPSTIPNAGDVISTTQEEKSHPWVNGTAKT